MLLVSVLQQALTVTAFVAVMMSAVEYVNVLTRGTWARALSASPSRQYLLAVVLGATPGCLGAFAVVTLYSHRMVTLGALVAAMIATSGDEAFVMLALFPGTAIALTAGLALLGWVAGVGTDLLVAPPPSDAGHRFDLHEDEDSRGHFLEEHLWRHVVLQHVPRIFAWTSGALLVTNLAMRLWPESSPSTATHWLVLGAASLLGLVPESGPHLLFVTLFEQGLVPLSTLVASSIVQDGHGTLPLLAYSRPDFLKVKGINLLIGLAVGGALMALGW